MDTPTHIGVNLGGWLILEKWLTPRVFAGTNAEDEWELSQTAEGRRRIRAHRKTFITEADFAWLAEHDVQLVRLPVPYWAVVDSNEYVSAQKELDWAMRMAETYGIHMLLDVHAAPGGQNRGDHSGRKGQMAWFDAPQNQQQTIDILKTLAKMYRDSPALWGVELLNEPEAKGHYWQLVRWYRRAYAELRGILRPGTRVVFHDAFRPLLFTGSLWPRKTHPVVMDVHWYGFALPITSFKRYVRWSRLLRIAMIRLVRLWQPVIVGEWSSVLPQAFFDERPQREHIDLLQRNIAMQREVYQLAEASMYWNYKAEGDGMWNFRWLVENGCK